MNARNSAEADDAVHHVEDNLIAEHRRDVLLQLGGGHQRQELVHEDEEADREQDVKRGYPAVDLKFLAVLTGRNFIEHDIGGKAQRPEAKSHGLTQCDHAANDRPSHPLVLFRGAFQGLGMRGNGAVGAAHADAPGVRRAHHDALQHRLAAHQGLFTAFQRRQIAAQQPENAGTYASSSCQSLG